MRWPHALLALAASILLGAAAPSTPVVSVNSVAEFQSPARNWSSQPKITLNGYYSNGDGGGSDIVLLPTATPTVVATATNGSTVLAVTSGNPVTQNWVIGMPLTDSAGKIPSNTFVAAITASTVTMTQAASAGGSGDTITAGCDNRITLFADGASPANCYRRTNIGGDLQKAGITNGSVYDALAFPTTVTGAGTRITNAMAVLGAIGVNDYHLNGVSIALGSTIALPPQASLSCDVSSGTPAPSGVYSTLKGTIFEAHGATITSTNGNDISSVHNCVIAAKFILDPTTVSTFSGYSFTYPPLVHSDLEYLRGNMILAGDVGLNIDTAKGMKLHDLHILGFDNCLHLNKATLLNLRNFWCDGNVGIFSQGGGGQTDFDSTDIEPFLRRQANIANVHCNPTGLSASNGVCSEEYWDIASIAQSPTTNSFGQHICRLTLALGVDSNGNSTVNFPGTDLHTSDVFSNGDPITFPAWIANLTNGLGCLGTGPYAITVISSSATAAVVDLNDSSFDAIPTVATYDIGSNILRIASGDTRNIQDGAAVTGTGIPGGTTALSIIRSSNGPDPTDGYIAEVVISANTTAASSGNQTVTFTSPAFSHSATCDGAGQGGCLFLNSSDTSFAGGSDAGVSVQKNHLSNHRHWSAGYAADNTPGMRSVNAFSFEHHYNFLMNDTNNCVFIEQHTDGNGELDDASLVDQAVTGSGNRCAVIGNGLGKAGTTIVTDLYSVGQSDTTTLADDVASTADGVTIHLAGSVAGWATDQGPGVAPGKSTVTICQTLNASMLCGNTAETSFAQYVDATHLKLLSRGKFNTNALTFTSGAHIFYSRVQGADGSALYSNMGTTVTDKGLNILEVEHGSTSLTNIEANAQQRGIFISHNAGPVTFLGVNAGLTAIYYEDPHALAQMSGCGNTFLVVQTWECLSGESIGAGLQISSASGLLETTGGQAKRTAAATSVILANSDCGSFVPGSGAGKTTFMLPSAPPAGCRFKLSPGLFDALVDFNGKILRLPAFGSHDITKLLLPFTIENSYLAIEYDGTQWDGDSRSAYFYQNINPLDTPQLTNGQVLLAYDGSTYLTVTPKNGPGGLIVTTQFHQVSGAGLKFNKSGTTSSATNYFYVGNVGADVVTGAVSDAGVIKLTLTTPIPGAAVGDQVKVSCYSVGGTVEANGTFDATIVTDTSHVDLIGSTFSNAYTSGGICRVDYLIASTTTHASATNGVDTKSGDGTLTYVGSVVVGGAHAVGAVSSWYNAESAITGAIKSDGSNNFSQAAASDLTNGTTGSNAVVLATSPTITTPTLSGNWTVTGHEISSGTALSSGDFVFGPGAGTSPTFTSVTGDDLHFRLSFTTGSAPSTSAVIFTLTFKSAYGAAPVCTFAPEGVNAAIKLVQVWTTPGTTTLVFNAGTVGLTAATAYVYSFICIQ